MIRKLNDAGMLVAVRGNELFYEHRQCASAPVYRSLSADFIQTTIAQLSPAAFSVLTGIEVEDLAAVAKRLKGLMSCSEPGSGSRVRT